MKRMYMTANRIDILDMAARGLVYSSDWHWTYLRDVRALQRMMLLDDDYRPTRKGYNWLLRDQRTRCSYQMWMRLRGVDEDSITILTEMAEQEHENR
jgi:hypothetical protein